MLYPVPRAEASDRQGVVLFMWLMLASICLTLIWSTLLG